MGLVEVFQTSEKGAIKPPHGYANCFATRTLILEEGG